MVIEQAWPWIAAAYFLGLALGVPGSWATWPFEEVPK